ncbi:MAG TPA: oligosaccharide flippase family protein [Roseiflexaceae bacterium]|nr:oligosaccharide flippase family protein [Roseiflexaceae bacterium]
MISKWVAASRVQSQAFVLRIRQSSVRTLIGGVAVSAIGQFAAGVLGVVTSALIVRQLGPERYGEYTLLLTALALLTGVLGFGLDTWLLKVGGQEPHTLANNLYQVLLLKVAGALLLLVLLAIGWSNHVVYSPAFLVGVAGVILSSFAQTGYAALRATRHNLQVALFQALEPALLFGALLITDATSLTVLLLMVVRAACSAVLFVLLMRRVWEFCGHARGGFRPLPVIRGAWLFVGADVLANVYSQTTFIILGATAGAAAVGAFRPAVDLLTLIQTVPNLMFNVALPLLSGAAPREFRSLLKAMAFGAALYGLSACAGIWVLGDRALIGMYGARFHAALPYLLTLSLVPLLKAGSLVSAAVMLARGHIHLRVAAQCLVAAASVGAGWLLIPAFGTQGAAWNLLVIEVLIFSLYAAGAATAIRRSRR